MKARAIAATGRAQANRFHLLFRQEGLATGTAQHHTKCIMPRSDLLGVGGVFDAPQMLVANTRSSASRHRLVERGSGISGAAVVDATRQERRMLDRLVSSALGQSQEQHHQAANIDL